jgi:Ca2+-binding RTX toxin-like protein
MAVATLAVGAAAAVLIAGQSTAAPQLRSSAHGAISKSNSRDGRAIFTAQNLAPGGSVSGSVTIGNTGSAPGSLVLSAADLSDSPGVQGGILSSALDLRVTDVTAGSDLSIYSGKLGDMPEQRLVTLMPGDQRTYRFVASLPDGGEPASDGSGDNAFQQASASVDYRWTLAQVAAGPRCANPLRGDGSSNRLFGTLAGDRITAYAGADLVVGGEGADCLRGGRGPDSVQGEQGADRLRGGPGPDLLQGGDGDDRLRAGRGNDSLTGGAGDDLIRARLGGSDAIRCGSGTDTVVIDRHERLRGCEIVRIRGDRVAKPGGE